MAHKDRIPLDRLRDVAASAAESSARRRETVRIAIELDPLVPRELALAVRDALMPQTATGLVHVGNIVPGAPLPVSPATDLALVIAGGSEAECAATARAFASQGVPCAIVAQTSVDAPGEVGAPGVALVAAATREVLLEKLASWMADACGKDLALASCFPFCRRTLALRSVRAHATQNAAVGALFLIPGADFPVMCANQAKMLVEVGAIFGRDITVSGAAGLVGVLAAGSASRALARSLVSALPGLGWAVKAGIAFGATTAMGHALVARLEGEDEAHGASVS